MRAVIVGSVVLGGVGLGSVAAATGLLPGWDRITTASGDSCDVAVVPSAKEERWGAPDEMPFTRYEQERTLAAAEAYLAGFDYDTVDRRDAIADWQRVEQRVRAAAEPGERQPRLVGDDLEVFAVSRAVMDLLADHLEQRGLDSAAIEVSLLADGCEL